MKNVFWSILNTFQSQGIRFLFSIALANLIEVDVLAIYIAVNLVTAYGVKLLFPKYESSIIRFLNDSEKKSEVNEYFSAGLMLTILNGLLAAFLLFFFKSYILDVFELSEAESYYLLYVYLLLVLNPVVAYLNSVLVSRVEFKYIALSSTVIKGVALLGVSLVLIFRPEIEWIFQAFVLMNGALIISYVMRSKKYFSLTTKIRWTSYSGLLKFSSLLYLSAAAVFLDKNLDVFLVNKFLSKAELAYYNYAIKLALLLVLVGNALSNVLYSKMTRLHTSREIGRLRELCKNVLEMSLYFIGSLGILGIFLIDFLVVILFPDSFVNLISPFSYLMISISLFSGYAALGTLLSSINRPGAGALGNWIAVGLNLGFGILLIPKIGMLGAVVSTSISFVLRVAILSYFEYKFISSGINHALVVSKFLIFMGCCLALKFWIVDPVWNIFVGFLAVVLFYLYNWGVSLKPIRRLKNL